LVHAAATVDEYDDLGASAGSDNLGLRTAGAGETHDDACDRQNREGGSQPTYDATGEVGWEPWEVGEEKRVCTGSQQRECRQG
jgi:hypothetical protein